MAVTVALVAGGAVIHALARAIAGTANRLIVVFLRNVFLEQVVGIVRIYVVGIFWHVYIFGKVCSHT